ncbi:MULTISPECIES: NAD(P)/FAD-dependent oxidoreductase [Halocynthiibacter]|uniref:FAD-dependent oxidoreductase n=1 Tax=Halocynthiibacter halioticoli TaxID=2986804 RepID=A0AAE3LPJ5_9RHOB|nr:MULTISPECIES: FAD-dependent oxidoreductase [Halocynthiibacter]MCV6823467.1 FAD-dependent oxidoreductase [Halocynthiibacter halioticoli]MCW4056468.1 FAD-dependent oxidoreductase [Halocynthiibacter sp. SDUM655004]
MNSEIIVIGAGIIGISAALELRQRGFDVCVVDREGVAAEASQGNAGAFAFSDFEPLATPGIMLKAPKWLLDPTGPLSIPPAYATKIAPWMWRFAMASNKRQYDKAVSAHASLMALSREALKRQIEITNGADFILPKGELQLHESEAEYRAALRVWDARSAHGVTYTKLESPDAIAEVQPGLSPRFTHGVFTPDWLGVTDPKLWTEHLAKAFVNAGGRIERAEVRSVEHSSEGVSLTTSGEKLQAKQVVIASGAWSHFLTRTLGDRLPLETERGYNTTLPAGAFDLKTQITFSAHGFVASKIGEGIRVGGAVELGGLKLAPNYKRAEVLLDKAKQFMPALDTEGGKQWMGFRPSMPDSLPVIGTAPKAPNVHYAFGHGHLGLTQSAGTAELIADMVERKSSKISLEPFAPNRF